MEGNNDTAYMLTETNWKGFTVRVIFRKTESYNWSYFDCLTQTWKSATKTPFEPTSSMGLLSVQDLLLSLVKCKDIHLMETFLEYIL